MRVFWSLGDAHPERLVEADDECLWINLAHPDAGVYKSMTVKQRVAVECAMSDAVEAVRALDHATS